MGKTSIEHPGSAVGARYLAGASLRQLAKAYGVSVDTVRRWLVSLAVTSRPKVRYRTSSPFSMSGEVATVDVMGRRGVVGRTVMDLADFVALSPLRLNMSSKGYALVSGRARSGVPLHRLILTTPHGIEVDHINRDKLDNRRVNLRAVPRGCNAQNVSGWRRHQLPRGVYLRDSGRFRAAARVAGTLHILGTFATAAEAADAVVAFRHANMPYSNEDAAHGLIVTTPVLPASTDPSPAPR